MQSLYVSMRISRAFLFQGLSRPYSEQPLSVGHPGADPGLDQRLEAKKNCKGPEMMWNLSCLLWRPTNGSISCFLVDCGSLHFPHHLPSIQFCLGPWSCEISMLCRVPKIKLNVFFSFVLHVASLASGCQSPIPCFPACVRFPLQSQLIRTFIDNRLHTQALQNLACLVSCILYV